MIAPKSFYAHLFDASGILAKVDGELVFFADNGGITTVEAPDINFLVVLGEVGLANARQILDRIAGGYAAVACGRAQEVA